MKNLMESGLVEMVQFLGHYALQTWYHLIFFYGDTLQQNKDRRHCPFKGKD